MRVALPRFRGERTMTDTLFYPQQKIRKAGD